MSGYQYVVLRCVPRVEREEFVNVGVVLYCPAEDFLASGSRVDEQRLRALDPRVDVAAVRSALAAVESVCSGEAHVDFGLGSRATSYGVLKAPRSTVLQPGPVHGGMTADPARELERLVSALVG